MFNKPRIAHELRCFCEDCPPGTTRRLHLLNEARLKESRLRSRYSQAKIELKKLKILPPKDADFISFQKTLTSRKPFIPAPYLTLLRDFFSLRKEMEKLKWTSTEIVSSGDDTSTDDEGNKLP